MAAHAILALYRAYREARTRSDLIGERLGEDSFLAEASNHILSLITTIRSYSEILKDYGDLSEAERHRFIGTLVEESERLAARAGDMFDFLGGRGGRRPRPAPREEIEDFISDHANYFPRLEAAAEEIGRGLGDAGPTVEILVDRLARRHGVKRRAARRRTNCRQAAEHFDRAAGSFRAADALSRRSLRFRLARLAGYLEYGALLDELVASAALSSPAAAAWLKRALASYFAGALTMPYAAFLAAADGAPPRHRPARARASMRASSRSATGSPRCAGPAPKAFPCTSCGPTSPATSPSASAPRGCGCRATAAPVRAGSCTTRLRRPAASSPRSPGFPTATPIS